MKLTELNLNEDTLRECVEKIIKYVSDCNNLEFPPEDQLTDIVNDIEEIILNEELIDELEEDTKKLKEIIRQLLWRFLHRNIANIEYEGEKIELGEWDYNYKIE